MHVSAEAIHDNVSLFLFLSRGSILKKKCWTNQLGLVLWERTGYITGIGFLDAKEDFLSKMQIPKTGGTIAPRKR
jgi:hypothetical protein